MVHADGQHAGGRARADPLRCLEVTVAGLGQLADVADRDTGELRDALDADAGGAQSGDVLADGPGVDVGLPAAVDPLSRRGAAGGGVGGGALWVYSSVGRGALLSARRGRRNDDRGAPPRIRM